MTNERTILPWYTEGPVERNGYIFFTTLAGGTIMRLDRASGELVDWAKGHKPNGQVVLPNEDHLVCDSGNASISRYDRSGALIGYDVVDECAGQKVRCPNDLTHDSEGGVYFTDSVRETGNVYYYHPDGTQCVLAENLDFPNGIALSLDERVLFIAESYKNRILCLPLASSGVAAGKWEVFAELPENSDPNGYSLPDGIRYRADGTLWVAHYGMQAVQVLNENGRLLKTCPMDFPLPSNLCFADDHLVVTGGSAEPGPGGLRMMMIPKI